MLEVANRELHALWRWLFVDGVGCCATDRHLKVIDIDLDMFAEVVLLLILALRRWLDASIAILLLP